MKAEQTTPIKANVVCRAMRADDQDLRRFAEAFARNSDRRRSVDALRWQYIDSPSGRLFVDLALADDDSRIAAIYATLPGTMRINGRSRLVVQSLDTLTDTDFRGRGLFVSLAKRTFERATAEDCALVYGFPNANSAHGFFKKLSWTELGPVPFLMRPLRTKYFMQRLPGRWRRLATALPDLQLVTRRARIEPPSRYRFDDVVRYDDRVSKLWEDFSSGVRLAIERDADYLRWRIADKPREQYRTIALYEGERLAALCVFTVKEKHGGRVGYVMELLHGKGDQRAAAHLLATAISEMATQAADVVLAWCLPHSPNRAVFRRCGFFTLPERLRPIELHFGARAFDSSLDAIVCDRSSWYLSYLDSDTV